MKTRTTFFVLALVILISGHTMAQTDFFWSFSDLDSGAINSPADGSFEIGDSGTVFLYYTTHGPNATELDYGAFLEINTSVPAVINITNAETFDFDIVVVPAKNADIGDRWFDSFGAGSVAADGQSASINAFRVVGGDGIINNNTGPIFLDLGYDTAADAFLFGKVDFDVVGSGSVNLEAEQDVILNFDTIIGSVTINVDDEVILGDLNGDGFVTLLDVQPFVEILQSGGYQKEADMDQNGFVTLNDVHLFIAAFDFP